MHSMQAGYMDKAQKYTDKALMQIEKLKSECFMQHVASLQNNNNCHPIAANSFMKLCRLTLREVLLLINI